MLIVNEGQFFKPPRRDGLTLQIAVILLLATASGWALWRAFQSVIGLGFVLYLFLSLLAAGLVPVLIYRSYALYKANYWVERDGIRLNWGLRSEDIPMDEVLWVRSLEEVEQSAAPQELLATDPPGQVPGSQSMPRPWLRWPGAVLGTRSLPDGGQVEFMAANSTRLVLIATPGTLYAITPADPAAFRKAYQRFAEMGSLSPITARSVYPTFLISRVWNELPARTLLLAGLALSLILLVWVSLVVPGLEQISLGYNPDGSLRDPVPPVQLLLLPLVNAFFFLVDALLGLYFYRRGDTQVPSVPLQGGKSIPIGQVMAYLLWGSGALTALFFLVALMFLLRAQ